MGWPKSSRSAGRLGAGLSAGSAKSADDKPLRAGGDLEMEVIARRPVVVGAEHHVEQARARRVAEDAAKLGGLGGRRSRAGAVAARRGPDAAVEVALDLEDPAVLLHER